MTQTQEMTGKGKEMKFAIQFDGFNEPTRYTTRAEAEQALSSIRTRMGGRFHLLFQYSCEIVEIQD